jgi:hypothetical protein
MQNVFPQASAMPSAATVFIEPGALSGALLLHCNMAWLTGFASAY